MLNKKIYVTLLALAVLAIGIGSFYAWQWQRDRVVDVTVNETISRPDLSFSFAFPSGNESLGFMQSAPDTLSDPDILQVFLLADAAELQTPEAGTPGGNISIFVFNWSDEMGSSTAGLPAREKLEAWATAQSGYTTFSEATTIAPAEIDGAPAIKFSSAGDFQREVYLSRYDGKVYLFVSQYVTEGDVIDTAFDTVINSVVFN